MVDSMTHVRLDIRGFLQALTDGWQSYLPALADLSAEEIAAYLDEQGYDRLRDLLAGVTAHIEETLGAISLLLRDANIEQWDEPVSRAAAIARFSYFTEDEVRRRFTLAYTVLARMLAFLPEAALERPEIYGRLYRTIVTRFSERRPPNMLAAPQQAL
ncbi:MAG TPA: hypothetical protein VH349_02075 [Ktedonobacterales bacterium]|jgi:hypothetical protein